MSLTQILCGEWRNLLRNDLPKCRAIVSFGSNFMDWIEFNQFQFDVHTFNIDLLKSRLPVPLLGNPRGNLFLFAKLNPKLIYRVSRGEFVRSLRALIRISFSLNRA